jgi:hypothetical protein
MALYLCLVFPKHVPTLFISTYLLLSRGDSTMKTEKKYWQKYKVDLSSVHGKFGLILLAFTLFSLMIVGCIERPPKEKNYYFFSFEEDMQGWVKDGTDLDNPPINWSIERSQDLVYHRNTSVKLYLNNLNDAGKIWIERSFNVSPNSRYEVIVTYMFATGDFGDFNLFRIITGVSTQSPENASDLTIQEDTGHHQETEHGFIWLEKNYTFTVQSDTTGKLFVSIGVWGTWETHRTYYLDSVNITFSKISVDEIPILNGAWAFTCYDWTGNVTKTQRVSIKQSAFTVTILLENQTLCKGALIKNNL